MKTLRIKANLDSIWLGMENYKLTLDQNEAEVFLKYIGEAPHGDSYFSMYINNECIKGYVWGCMYLFPFNQAYIICSWMEKIYERKTIIIDHKSKKFSILDTYWYDYKEDEDKIILSNNNFNEIRILDISQISNWIKY